MSGQHTVSAPQDHAGPWTASEKHWDALQQSGRALGWKLAALSFGFAPIARVTEFLPEQQQKDELTQRRKVINTNSHQPDNDGPLRYEVVGRNITSGIECLYDVVKFVDFVESLEAVPSYSNAVHSRMKVIAEDLRKRRSQKPTSLAESSMPTKNQKAGKTRADDSLLKILLAMAIIHHEYIPLGFEGSSKPNDMNDVYASISEFLCLNKLGVSPDIIEKRLLEAVGNLEADGSAELELVVRKVVAERKARNNEATTSA